MKKDDYKDKTRGMLVGLAVGDALGAPVEFGFSSERIEELGDQIEHFHVTRAMPENFPVGGWTDDTSMALCLADSIIEKQGYDSYDIIGRFVQWFSHGYRSSVDRAIGIGEQTANAINAFLKDPVIHKNTPKTENAGNGAIMRLAPVVIAGITNDSEDDILERTVLSCRETHNSIAAECVTEMFAKLLCSIFYGLDKNDVKNFIFSYRSKNEQYNEFLDNNANYVVTMLENGDEVLKNLGGYILDTFIIATWGLINSKNFKDGMLKVIQLGGDTDTNAAVYGQLAGAYYGYNKIPEEWRKDVYLADELVRIADRLFNMQSCPILRTRFEDNKYFRRKNGIL